MNIAFWIILFHLAPSVVPQGWRYVNSQNSRQNIARCDRSSRCVSIGRCPAISNSVWRNNVATCGYNKRGRPKVCCQENKRKGKTKPKIEKIENMIAEPKCGISTYNNFRIAYIMGGRPAKPGQFPWMAALLKKTMGTDDFSCTAFVIGPRYVLTAAHCIRPLTTSLYSVRVGNLDWRKGSTYQISRISIPSGYKHGAYYDDIAVLRLKESITDPNVTPICLPSAEIQRMDLSEQTLTVAGWGASRSGGSMSNTLQQLSSLPVMPNGECERTLSRLLSSFRTQFDKGMNNGFICAGFSEGRKDSCEGDSGGPLMLRHQGTWYAVGIVSFGVQCGLPGVPAGYTRISQYMDFIQRHTT